MHTASDSDSASIGYTPRAVKKEYTPRGSYLFNDRPTIRGCDPAQNLGNTKEIARF